jgi:hypothetical protein
VRARHECTAQPTPRRAAKGVEMIALKMISQKISAWLWDREAAREWVQFSDPELCPIRIRRSDFEDVVRRRGGRRTQW